MKRLRAAPLLCVIVAVGCVGSTATQKIAGPPAGGSNKSGDAKAPSGGKTVKFKEDLKTETKGAKKPASPDLPWDASVTMENKTDMNLEFFVDGVSKGTSVAGLPVTAVVSAGSRTLMATTSGGQSVSRTVDVAPGDSIIWTVSLEPAR